MNRGELRGFGISVILVVVMLAFSVTQTTRGQASYDTTAVQNQLEEQLRAVFIENYSQYYKDIGVSLTPKDVTIKDGIATAVFDAAIDLTLKAERVEDLPFVKGMLECLDSKRSIATKAQIDESNRLVEDWRLELKDYIGKPEPTAHGTYKIVANLANDGTVTKDTVKLYIDAPSSTSTNEGDVFYPVPLPMLETSEKEEENGRNLIEEAFKKMTVDSGTALTYSYTRTDARDYANTWTSEVPRTEQYCCSHGGIGGACDCWQDISKWNSGAYPYYPNSFCQDCADYVSQALRKGGIPIDPGQWDRNNDSNGQYPWAWTYAPALKSYMVNHGHWTPSNFTNANAGCVIQMTDGGHTVLIVLNDTHTRQYSAHTTDSRQHPYYSSNGWYYYTVQ